MFMSMGHMHLQKLTVLYNSIYLSAWDGQDGCIQQGPREFTLSHTVHIYIDLRTGPRFRVIGSRLEAGIIV